MVSMLSPTTRLLAAQGTGPASRKVVLKIYRSMLIARCSYAILTTSKTMRSTLLPSTAFVLIEAIRSGNDICMQVPFVR